jgi:hypothetical protein
MLEDTVFFEVKECPYAGYESGKNWFTSAVSVGVVVCTLSSPSPQAVAASETGSIRLQRNRELHSGPQG